LISVCIAMRTIISNDDFPFILNLYFQLNDEMCDLPSDCLMSMSFSDVIIKDDSKIN
jgi:hypothetical protein